MLRNLAPPVQDVTRPFVHVSPLEMHQALEPVSSHPGIRSPVSGSQCLRSTDPYFTSSGPQSAGAVMLGIQKCQREPGSASFKGKGESSLLSKKEHVPRLLRSTVTGKPLSVKQKKEEEVHAHFALIAQAANTMATVHTRSSVMVEKASCLWVEAVNQAGSDSLQCVAPGSMELTGRLQ